MNRILSRYCNFSITKVLPVSHCYRHACTCPWTLVWWAIVQWMYWGTGADSGAEGTPTIKQNLYSIDTTPTTRLQNLYSIHVGRTSTTRQQNLHRTWNYGHLLNFLCYLDFFSLMKYHSTSQWIFLLSTQLREVYWNYVTVNNILFISAEDVTNCWAPMPWTDRFNLHDTGQYKT